MTFARDWFREVSYRTERLSATNGMRHNHHLPRGLARYADHHGGKGHKVSCIITIAIALAIAGDNASKDTRLGAWITATVVIKVKNGECKSKEADLRFFCSISATQAVTA